VDRMKEKSLWRGCKRIDTCLAGKKQPDDGEKG